MGIAAMQTASWVKYNILVVVERWLGCTGRGQI
jgi:hypothetical protein